MARVDRLRAAVSAVVSAAPPVVGLVLVSYGAWLAYEPAGFVVAGVVLLADTAADRAMSRREPRSGAL